MGLEDEISRLKERIAEHERQGELLRAELKGMMAARRYVSERARPQGLEAGVAIGAVRVTTSDAGGGKRGGRQPGAISTRWQNVLRELYGAVFDAETVAATVFDLESRIIKPSEVRRIFDGYIEQGLAEKTENGLYRVSTAAAHKYGFRGQAGSDANNEEGREERPSENAGGEMVRERGYPPSAPGGSIPPTSTVPSSSPLWPDTPGEATDDDIPF